METMPRRYPLGIQTFQKIIEENMLYVDKTELIYKLTQSYSYVFLSRPRRFGKSLLVSTLASYFRGEKELFKGLAMERLEKQWKKHPVIHLSLASVKAIEIEGIIDVLNYNLASIEEEYDILPVTGDLGNVLRTLLSNAMRNMARKQSWFSTSTTLRCSTCSTTNSGWQKYASSCARSMPL